MIAAFPTCSGVTVTPEPGRVQVVASGVVASSPAFQATPISAAATRSRAGHHLGTRLPSERRVRFLDGRRDGPRPFDGRRVLLPLLVRVGRAVLRTVAIARDCKWRSWWFLDRARASIGGGRASSQFACSSALSAPQLPSRGSASSAPLTLLRRNSSPLRPDSSRALTTEPSGRVTREPPVT